MPPIREERTPQTRPVVSARAACRGDTQTIRPIRRSIDGFVVTRRAPPLRRRRVRAGAALSPLLVPACVLAVVSFRLTRWPPGCLMPPIFRRNDKDFFAQRPGS